VTADAAPADLTLTVGALANGGSCVSRHEGRVVFVRYALPGELVRVRVTANRGAYWHAEAFEVLEPSPQRIEPLCPIAGVDGAGCCDLAFAEPAALRELKGQVVTNQLERLGNFEWHGPAQALSGAGPTGWRTRVRLGVGADGRAGFHRYHSGELITDLRCAQLTAGMLDGLDGAHWTPGAQLLVVVDDDSRRHVVEKTKRGRRTSTEVVEGDRQSIQRVSERIWRIPATGFWQAHRDAARVYSGVIRYWAQPAHGMTAWDLYGGAGLFAAVLGEAVGESGRVLTVDTSSAASRAARGALADLPQVQVLTDSVRRALAGQRQTADVAVLDPPRSGAGREVIELLGAAGVPRIVHIGCEAAAFARDVGLYREHGYDVDDIKVFDAFPLTHHVECVALLTRPSRPV
jgi:tRNA/tmRNA/rRNA uracil-C5-methylase (TrmA/RlmC/RlmD family)